MNKKYLVLLLIFILVPLAYSAIEYDWLISKASTNNWNNDVQDTSLSLLALKSATYTQEQASISWLETKMNSCMTSDSCNIKDASFALLALSELSSSSATTTKLKNWLLNASIFQYSGETSGWNAQIISTVAGSCILSDPQNPDQPHSIVIDAGFTPWFDIHPLISTTTNSIKIDCTSLSPSPISLSLIREADTNRYYINKEVTNQKEIILELGYPCWGTTPQAASCDKESTAFALFALKPAADPKWLENQASLTPLQNALLYSVTESNTYLTKTLDAQNRFGYWGSAALFETAFISYLIPDSDEKAKALSWLTSQKATDEDCWPKPKNLCNVKSTAAAILSQSAISEISENGTITEEANKTEERKDQQEEKKGGTTDCPEDSSCTTSDACPGACDYWGMCQDVEGDNCPEGDTKETQETDCPENSVCTTGACPGKCNAFGECIDTDDSCTPESVTPSAAQTKEEGSSLLFWILMILLLLIIIAGGGYLAYKKGLLKFKKTTKPGPSAPLFRHPFSPASQIPQRRPIIKNPVKGRIQHELDSSINEMEKFLKGKKR